MPRPGGVGVTTLPPWLQRQLGAVLALRGHAVLLDGPAGLGQYELALALARRWLCEQPRGPEACGACAGCRAVDARTHADLFVLLPDALALELGWPLDPSTAERIERKEIKPSRQIRVEATRAAIRFATTTSARGQGKVVLIHPAERLNAESANALLKTLEEPPAGVRFVLASEASHALLPTIRSRCQRHAMAWPSSEEGLAWLTATAAAQGLELNADDWQACWRAAAGRPAQALQWAQLGLRAPLWRTLPRRLAAGDLAPIAEWPLPRQLEALMLLCHDALACALGAPTRHFDAADVPAQAPPRKLAALWRALQQAHRHIEHPWQPGLWTQAWAERVRTAFSPTVQPTLHSRP
ncbi:DNA polymerase-3 subunit delta' [Tepidimonas ignava]|uniref:DNA polymerase III subunit delta n=1 Tax=Tepidimonas ignava TaxID=114249 RepID=A0A4V2UV24_9BURK|nr:DNA polymerase-3 subunit delta' [Tepidimonas ignava]TSE24137.1 DNA polymerase III subunit delta' [Tepidimonas ignava]